MERSKIKEEHLSRAAYVYIRQSSQYQAEHNRESQSLQYQLVEKAKELGFKDVRVIDEDLGISATGYSERSGFKRLVAEVSLNKVGIILGIEVSRLSRNNRDFYQLIDLCALFNTLIADRDGIYHPAHTNDRMVLGLKGTMSEIEINILKGRMLEGARNKAKRGELIYRLPIGYVKTEDGKIEKDPDMRIQDAIEQVFGKFRQSRSVRQTFLWFVQEQVTFPSIKYGRFGKEIVWKSPIYNTIWHVLKNPTYAGAYAYGTREQKKYLDGENIRKRRIQLKMKDWKVLIKDNHSGYISWEEFEKNQGILEENAKAMGWGRGPALKGNSLLSGLLRCRRCGRKLLVAYGGKDGKVPRYFCGYGRLHQGEKECIYFGGMRVDEAIAKEVMRVVEPLGIDASLKAIDEYNNEIGEQKKRLLLELESAEYEAERAYRQYNKVDPDNRLVVGNLESKWNRCLEEVERIKEKLGRVNRRIQPLSPKERAKLCSLSEDLAKLWNSSTTTNQMRKRVIRAVIEEIMVDVNEEHFLILLDIHWAGGIHSSLKIKKNRSGEHSRCTDKSVVELVRDLAKQLPDKSIAPLLNRLKIKTGAGNNWTRDRVRVLRNYNKIPAYNRKKKDDIITLKNAARKLGVCDQSVRGLIKKGVISARQIIAYAPYSIPIEELEREEVKIAIEQIKKGLNRKKNSPWCKGQLSLF